VNGWGSYRKLLVSIVLLYVALGVTYALATPPLEASDEYKHYPFVQYVQTQRVLPVLDTNDPGLWLQEAAQPPLYYFLMASLTTWIDTNDLPDVHRVNPHAFIGIPGHPWRVITTPLCGRQVIRLRTCTSCPCRPTCHQVLVTLL